VTRLTSLCFCYLSELGPIMNVSFCCGEADGQRRASAW
jgi:hypothetical protein